MKRPVSLLATAALAVAIPSLAIAGPPAVSGGGTTAFDVGPKGEGTIFSVEASIDVKGIVSGHFFRATDVVVIVGDVFAAAVNGDGSLTLAGFAHGFHAKEGVFEKLPFVVQVWGGGPGVGKIVYDDPFVGTEAVTLKEGDPETVATGVVLIRVVKN